MTATITFNGKSFADFDTFYDGTELFSIPEKDVSFYPVPGRNGDLSVSNNRYKNIDIPIYCWITEDPLQNFSDLMDYLTSQEGYGRLETSAESDIYRVAQFLGNVDPRLTLKFAFADFTLTFNCKPQKFLKSGENAITVTTTAQTLSNPTKQIALPLIEVTGTGKITVNSSELTLSTNTGTTLIDCETQDCYQGTTNRNGDLTVVGGFPVLGASNTVSMTGFTTCNIYPRWWKL